MSSNFPDHPRDLTPDEASALARDTAAASAPPQPNVLPPNVGRAAGAVSSSSGPTVAPPSASRGGATGARAGSATQAGGSSGWTTVGALWCINQADNAWFYDNAVGWKKIANGSDVGVESMNAVASHAKALGSQVQYTTDDTSGLVTEIYCF
jgi:hypothetical protein